MTSSMTLPDSISSSKFKLLSSCNTNNDSITFNTNITTTKKSITPSSLIPTFSSKWLLCIPPSISTSWSSLLSVFLSTPNSFHTHRNSRWKHVIQFLHFTKKENHSKILFEKEKRLNSNHLTFSPSSLNFNRKQEKKNETETENEDPNTDTIESAPLFILITTYLSYLILIFFGLVRDIFEKWVKKSDSTRHLRAHDGYAPLVSDFESFYSRRLYYRIRDCWSRPVTGVPGRFIQVSIHRTEVTTTSPNHNESNSFLFKKTKAFQSCLNLSSYNYLGFAQANGPCAEKVKQGIQSFGLNLCSSRNEVGLHQVHVQLESQVAQFLGTEDALCINMGFATNTTTLPLLVSKGCLIVSDELNHASLVFGARLSGASIQVFKHNCPTSLEIVLRKAISQGQPRTHRPWKKILVVVEGLYSMEGHLCKLPEFLKLKKKYKFYLFIDEAHSIGALGFKGRGICDHYQIDPNQIDILMGTFTKSFGAAGGYIAGKKCLIQYLRTHGHASFYADPVPIPIAYQIMASMHELMNTEEGEVRLHQLRENALFFRQALIQRGYIVLGDIGSPVIPMLIFNPGKLPAFSRCCLNQGLAVVVVGAPATPIVSSRVRFCISASHTLKDLHQAVEIIDQIGQLLCLNLVAPCSRSLQLSYQEDDKTEKEKKRGERVLRIIK